MVVRVRVTQERLYDVEAASPQEAEAKVRGQYLPGDVAHAAQAGAGIASRGRAEVTVRALQPRITRSERRKAARA
jgi:hypothetical protein